jgi:hypothetical protein
MNRKPVLAGLGIAAMLLAQTHHAPTEHTDTPYLQAAAAHA